MREWNNFQRVQSNNLEKASSNGMGEDPDSWVSFRSQSLPGSKGEPSRKLIASDYTEVMR